MKVVTRIATKDDLDTLLQFEQELITVERAFDPTFKDETIAYYNIPAMIADDQVKLLIAEIDGIAIGCGYARIAKTHKIFVKYTMYAYLGFMYVLPEWRGKGMNKIIMDELIEWILSKEVYEVRLDVYHTNNPAIRAYQKVGFKGHLLDMRMDLRTL